MEQKKTAKAGEAQKPGEQAGKKPAQETRGSVLAPEAEKKELVDTLQRLQAEFENYKKRVEKEKPVLLAMGKARAVAEMLGVLDSFDAAGQKLKKENRQDAGLELLHRQFLQALQRLGVQESKTLGEKFSHETMDCVMRGNEKGKPDGIVLEEFQKGYCLDGMVLRHAKVKVNKLEETGNAKIENEGEKK